MVGHTLLLANKQIYISLFVRHVFALRIRTYIYSISSLDKLIWWYRILSVNPHAEYRYNPCPAIRNSPCMPSIHVLPQNIVLFFIRTQTNIHRNIVKYTEWDFLSACLCRYSFILSVPLPEIHFLFHVWFYWIELFGCRRRRRLPQNRKAYSIYPCIPSPTNIQTRPPSTFDAYTETHSVQDKHQIIALFYGNILAGLHFLFSPAKRYTYMHIYIWMWNSIAGGNLKGRIGAVETLCSSAFTYIEKASVLAKKFLETV